MADTSNSIDVYGNVIGDSVHFAADKYNVKAGWYRPFSWRYQHYVMAIP